MGSALKSVHCFAVCERAVGGLVTTILYGLKDDVQSWPQKQAAALRTRLADHIETVAGYNIVMKPGKRMFKMVIKKNSGELKYTEQGESGSKSFKPTLEIYSSTLRAQILGFLAATANQEIFILAKTRNGDWHLLGDEYEGVEHESAEATSGKLGSDNHGAQITFFTETDAPTIYKGDVDSLTVVGGERATFEVLNDSYTTSVGLKLTSKVSQNDDIVTEVGFYYRFEEDDVYVKEQKDVFNDGESFEITIAPSQIPTSVQGGVYCAYMVANGVEIRSQERIFVCN